MAQAERRSAQGLQRRSVDTTSAILEGAARVFSRVPYAAARLADVCRESGISQGSLYFHFGNKADIAAAVLRAQDERMASVVPRVRASGGNGLGRLIEVNVALAELISSDRIVQAGIKLGMQAGLDDVARGPYFEWVEVAVGLISDGIDDGSISRSVDVRRAAEFVTKLFIGTLVLSELEDSWASFPVRIRELLPFVHSALTAANEVAPEFAHKHHRSNLWLTEARYGKSDGFSVRFELPLQSTQP